MATHVYLGYPAENVKTWIESNQPKPDGTEQNPFLLDDISAIEQLRKDVANGDCKEGVHFKQRKDFDMTGYEWEGIGLKNGDDPDPAHTFKGIYDGNGHTIKNLQFKYVEGGDNELMGFIRSAMGAEVKNLTIHSTGFKDPTPGAKFGGAILVGTAKDGIKISNCTVSGNMGSEESPCGHTASGILSYITLPSDNKPAKECPVELKNVTNNADIYSTRKTGGVIGFALGHISLENVTNNGKVARVGDDNGKADAVGGIVAYGHGDVAAYAVTYDWNNVTNTGTVTSNMSGRAEGNYVGQIVGKWAHQTAASKNSGSVKIKSDETPLSKYCPTNGSGTHVSLLTHLPVYFGEIKEDGYVYGVSELENGKSYLYMVCNYGEGAANNPITGPAFTLADGASITVDCKFGTPNITKADGTSVVGELVEGTIYRYTAS